MADLLCKVRYFKIGEQAPKNSCFKGIVTPESIFGGAGSYFNYCERYVDKENISLMKYTSRYGFTYSDDGYLDTKEKKQTFIDKGKQSISKQGSIVYEIVCSLADYEVASKYDLTGQEQFAAVTSVILPRFLTTIGLDPNNVSWWQDFHPENRTSTTPHPHIHLLFFEDEPTHTFARSYGKLPKKALNKFKMMFASEMIKREDQSIYRDLFNDINFSKRNLLNNIKHTNFDKVESLKDLYAILPKSGRLQINSANMAPYRQEVYKVVDKLLESKECKDVWNEYCDSLDDYEYKINRRLGYEVSSRKDEDILKTKKQIANLILSNKKTFIDENKYENLVKNKNYKDTDNSKSRTYKDPSIVRNRLSRRNSEIPMKRAINGLVAKRQHEIEEEIEQYLNERGYGYEL